jgi:hypothetical protein
MTTLTRRLPKALQYKRAIVKTGHNKEHTMPYFFGVALPALLQCLVIFIVIQMNTGNGSWAGLGALLIGLFAVPATAIANVMIIRASADKEPFTAVVQCFMVALITPVLVVFLTLIG